MKGTFKQLFLLAFMAFSVVITGCNNHEYVDLGLPSGTKWATCNIGAENPEDYGDYYAWGETRTKTDYSRDSYRYSDDPTILSASADAATANWGNGWRMPTEAEFQELIDRCNWKWTGSGYKVTGPNGKSIFLPAAGYRNGSETRDVGSYGYYWSSSLYSDYTDTAWNLYFYSGSHGMDNYYRNAGQSVRAVRQ